MNSFKTINSSRIVSHMYACMYVSRQQQTGGDLGDQDAHRQDRTGGARLAPASQPGADSADPAPLCWALGNGGVGRQCTVRDSQSPRTREAPGEQRRTDGPLGKRAGKRRFWKLHNWVAGQKSYTRASLGGSVEGIHLPVQGARGQCLTPEDPTCHGGTTESVCP